MSDDVKRGTVHGAKYEYWTTDRDQRIRLVLDLPGAKNGRGEVTNKIVVTTAANADLPFDEVLAIATHQMTDAAVQNSSADDRATWEQRNAEAFKAVRRGQILRTYARGEMPADMAISRLVGAGHDFTEAAKHLDTIGPVELLNQPAPAEDGEQK